MPKLFVCRITGESKEVEAETVQDLYEACAKTFEASLDEFRLVANGKNLNLSLQEPLELKDGDSVFFVMNLRGGSALTLTGTNLKNGTETRTVQSYDPRKSVPWHVVDIKPSDARAPVGHPKVSFKECKCGGDIWAKADFMSDRM